jgi:DsbC/DsbD-like thiol-disulfide interchange protein
MLKNLLLSATIAITGALALATTTPAKAQGFSPDDVARVDVLPGWRTAEGTQMAALRVRLAPGWKTYWRAPGDAGIPPRFNWSRSGNLASVKFHWPTPKVYYKNGLRTVGYKGELILPIEMTAKQPGKPITLRAEVELGVCQDICVPITARLSADLKSGTARDPRISAAIARQPAPARSAGLRGVTCGVEPIADGLRLTARIDMPKLGRDEIAVFELSDQTIWISEASAKRQGRTLTATTEMVPPSNAPFLLNRSDVRITVLAAGQAVDIQGCTG